MAKEEEEEEEEEEDDEVEKEEEEDEEEEDDSAGPLDGSKSSGAISTNSISAQSPRCIWNWRKYDTYIKVQ